MTTGAAPTRRRASVVTRERRCANPAPGPRWVTHATVANTCSRHDGVVLLTLDSGRRVLIRPIRSGDKPALQAFLHALGEESVRRRFLVTKLRFSSDELHYLTEVDGVDHIALVAEAAGEPGRLVAVARCVRYAAAPDTAEMAIVVTDDLQGQGLGRRLAELLADRARAVGIRRFAATMLGDNLAARRLMTTISDPLAADAVSDGVREVLVDLAA